MMLFAGNLVTQQIIVGDLRRRRKAEAGLEVADTVPGKAPFSVSSSCDILCCTSMQDFSVLVYTSNTGTGWREAARLQHHSDQISGVSISSDSRRLVSCGWDGLVCVWSLENYHLLGSVRCGEYLNCVSWSQDDKSVFAGGKAGAVVKLADDDD